MSSGKDIDECDNYTSLNFYVGATAVSQYSGYATGCISEGLWLHSGQRDKFFCFLHGVHMWCPPNLLLNGYRGLFPPGVQLTTHLKLVPRLRMCVCVYIHIYTAIRSCSFISCTGNIWNSYLSYLLNIPTEINVPKTITPTDGIQSTRVDFQYSHSSTYDHPAYNQPKLRPKFS